MYFVYIFLNVIIIVSKRKEVLFFILYYVTLQTVFSSLLLRFPHNSLTWKTHHT